MESETVRHATEIELLLKPFTNPEIIEIGRAILPHLSSETNVEIGAIGYDVSAAVVRILRSRAGIVPPPPPWIKLETDNGE